MSSPIPVLPTLCVLSLLMAPVFSGPASAATVRQLSVKELNAAAQLIVRGRVEAVPAAWHKGRIFRSARIQAFEVLKGPLKPGQSVDVRLPGGVVGDVGQWVPGAPDLRRGDDVLLYLEKRPIGWVVVGFHQGAFHLEQELDQTLWAVQAGGSGGGGVPRRIAFEQLRHLASRR